MPLHYRGDHIGDLVVGVRAGERRLSGTDLAVLGLLATPLAVALHATRLSAELQISRAGLVTATEEERAGACIASCTTAWLPLGVRA